MLVSLFNILSTISCVGKGREGEGAVVDRPLLIFVFNLATSFCRRARLSASCARRSAMTKDSNKGRCMGVFAAVCAGGGAQ